MRKLGLGLATAGLAAALGLAGAAAPAAAVPAPNVMICHFAGNTAPTSWQDGGTTLTGDYVLIYEAGGPSAAQVSYCTEHGGLGVIWVNANSLAGRGVQLSNRVAGYPSGPGASGQH